MISETRERFLRAIVGTVPPERIAEIHFFPPIKQGGVESGVAVIAAGEPSAPPPSPPPSLAASVAEEMAGDEAGLPADAEPMAASSDHPTAVAYPVQGPADLALPDDESDEEPPADAAARRSAGKPAHEHPPHESMAAAVDAALDADDEPPLRHDQPVAIPGRAAATATDDIPTTPVLDDLASGEEPQADFDAPRDADPPALRFTVFTARYRLVLKGLDRGKWEAGVVAEADAPLLTVEAVVRGVQRRSGDIDDPERMSGDEVRAELARMDAAAAALRTPSSLRAG